MTFPDMAALAGHTFADIDGLGQSHREWMDAVGTALEALGGGTQVSVLPFAYNTPNLAAGVPVYIPVAGELLLDAWISVDTAWDGTTPLADYGFFTALAPLPGMLATVGAALTLTAVQDMTVAATVSALGLRGDAGANNALAALSSSLVQQFVPAAFVTADPICVCVSTDGTAGGTDPAATQGAAHLYLVTARPT